MYLNLSTLTQVRRNLFNQSGPESTATMMYCNHMLGVGFIKLSLFKHSQAYFKRLKGMHQHTPEQGGESLNTTTCTVLHWLQSPIFFSFYLPLSIWWDRGCHAVTVRGRHMNKCFPLRRCNLNRKATWQLCHIIKCHTHSYTPPLLLREGRLSVLCFMHVK